MSEKKRIACFFTAGYTELNAMKIFMRKINDGVDYIQLRPIGRRRSKDSIRNRHIESMENQQSGLTGDALIDFIVDFAGKGRFQEENYDAILIEDDKDARFLKINTDGTANTDNEAWINFKKSVQEKLKAKCPDIPIIFFFAAPEIEAWFVADFTNSFGYTYRSFITTDENKFFLDRFRKYVNENILTTVYRDCIEQYGFFDGVYRKLSEQLQNSLNEIDFLEPLYSKKQRDHFVISYSKKIHGEDMLKHIEPDSVLNDCNFYFREGYYALKGI